MVNEGRLLCAHVGQYRAVEPDRPTWADAPQIAGFGLHRPQAINGLARERSDHRRTNSPLWLRLSPSSAAGTLVNRINAPNRGEDQQPDLESRTRARAAPLSGLVAELVGCW
ncbi:MAG: hypothetical protein F4049_05790 [Gemmatimonadetes bacterium]|nr:hypothetical protein [Gemmatimonadota bacterium]